jgi:hypothetical protein
MIVVIASDEFPKFTGTPSVFNDLLEWNAVPSQGASIQGSIEVNSRHAAWEAAITNDTSLPGFPSPVHIEEISFLTAPADSVLTIQVDVSATNVSDGQLPSHVAVGLLPVDLEEVISDQIAGNEANKLPTAFYKDEPNNPMFMATRSGVNARLMVKMNVAASVASKILVGARKVGSAPILGSVASVAPPGKTPLSFDAYDGHHIYEIVAGYDANSSGVLETGEVAVVFSKTPKTDSAGGVVSAGLGNLDKIIIATQSAFDFGKSGAIGNNVWGTDYAGALISAFAHGSSSVAEGTTTSPHTIISKQPGLSHPVGAKWSPTLSADTHRVSFYNGSEAANDVNASYALPQVLESAIGTHLTAIRAASGSSWTYSGPYNFSVSRDLVVTEPEWIGLNELGYAFGKVTFIGTMHVSSRWVAGGKIEVGSVTYSGQFDDVYDFTYWGGDKAREASLTQVGHATLASAPEPNSGKVFFTRVVFSGTKSIGKEF